MSSSPRVSCPTRFLTVVLLLLAYGISTAGADSLSTSSSADDLAQTKYGLMLSDKREAREDWVSAKATIEASERWRKWISDQRTRVDDWIKLGLERGDLVATGIHGLVDAQGNAVRWTAVEPPGGGSEQQAEFKGAWVARMREVNTIMIGDAVRLWKVTGDTRYADWAASQLDLYANSFLKWPVQRLANGRSHMFRLALDQSYRCFALLDAARILQSYVPAPRYDTWKNGLFLPMAEDLKVVGVPRSNIALWQEVGLAAIAMRLRDDALLDYALTNPVGVRATVQIGLTSDYLWREGSLGYNTYVADALTKLLVIGSLEGYGSRLIPERTTARRLMLAPLDYRFDDGMLPMPGDDTSRPAAFSSSIDLQSYRVLPTYFAVENVGKQMTWEALLDPPPPLPANPPALPPVKSRNFPGNRMAVLRAGEWQVFIKYGQTVPNHFQEDALSFELYNGPQPISIDSGTVTYGDNLAKFFFSKGAGNNAPLVDGLGQSQWGTGNVTAFDSGRLTVEQPTYTAGYSVSTDFRIADSGFAERTSLAPTLGNSPPRRLGRVFHTACEVIPEKGMSILDASTAPPSTPSTAYWKVAYRYRAASEWSVKLNCSGISYRLSVSGPADQRVFIGKAPTTPIPNDRSFVYYETFANSASFEMAISQVK